MRRVEVENPCGQLTQEVDKSWVGCHRNHVLVKIGQLVNDGQLVS